MIRSREKSTLFAFALMAVIAISTVFILEVSVDKSADAGPPTSVAPIKIQQQSTPSDLALTGPETGVAGQPVVLTVSGLPTVDMSKTMGDQTAWVKDIRFDVSAPKGAKVQLDKELSMSISPWEWRLKITYVPDVNGTYVVICDWNQAPFGLAKLRTEVGTGPNPPPPVPPTPPVPPVPPPPEPPFPSNGLRALIIEDRESRHLLPAGQLEILTSEAPGSVLDELKQNCVKGPDGKTPEFKILDDNANTDNLPDVWKAAVAKYRSLNPPIAPPMWIISNGKGGVYDNLPATPDAAKAVLNIWKTK